MLGTAFAVLPGVSWLSVTDVAATLHVSRVTVYRLIDRGLLRVHRVARTIRVKSTDLDAYLDGVASHAYGRVSA